MILIFFHNARNDRWPDQFYERIKAAKKPLSVLNQAAGGNRVLADGLGPNALGRIDRDVLAQTGVKYAILFEGVNDIGTAAPNAADQNSTVARIISAFEQIATRLHAQRKYAYIATITPFGNNSYDDGYYRENSRLAINSWIRSNTAFDAVLDFDAAVRDPANMTRILPAYDSGDGLHMNPTGYGAIAASIPLDLFC
jgi:lysophospholipase L1-like esterase